MRLWRCLPFRRGSPRLCYSRGLLANSESFERHLQDPLSKFTRHAEPQAVPDIAFNDADGRQVRLSDWRGQLVLLNIWATWCAPCKAELPSLDRLQAKLGGKGFTVLALSTDRGGPKAPAQFFSREGITHLKVFNDKTGEAAIA